MRLVIFMVLLALSTSVHAGGSGGGYSFIRTVSTGSSGPGGYSDPKLIAKYPLQAGLNLYKITAYKYGY